MARISRSAATPSAGISVSSIQTPPQTVGSGRLLIAKMSHQNSSVPTLTDTSGGGIVWHQAVAPTNPLGGTNWLSIYYAYNISGTLANLQGTATWAVSAPYSNLVIEEFDSFGATDPLETTSTGNGVGTAAATGTLTITGTDVISAIAEADAGTSTFTSGTYTWATLSDTYFGDGYHIPVASEAASVTVGSGNWEIVAAAFKQTTTAPATPNTPTPINTATGVSPAPTLAWVAAGATSYDVYFGTSVTPPLVSTGQAAASYAPGALLTSTVYHWKIVANNGAGSTTGPVWSFTTSSAIVKPPIANTWFQQAYYQETPDAFWRLNDAASATVADDQSLNAYVASMVGGPILFGQSGWSGDGDTAALFPGSGYFNAGNVAALAYLSRFSVVAAFKTSGTGAVIYIVSKALSATGKGWALAIDAAGKPRFFAYNSAAVAVFDITSSAAYQDNAWHLAVGVYDPVNASLASLYVDNVLKASAVPSGTPDVNSARVLIGGIDNAGAGAALFSGSLDEIALYSYALTATQVSALYTARNKIANDMARVQARSGS